MPEPATGAFDPDRATSGLAPRAAPETPDGAEAPGATAALPAVPGFTVEAELGRGGMGVVYRARQEGLDRVVALKMIRAPGTLPLDVLLRFRLEAETAASIRHPHVVQVFEVGWDGERPFLAQEFLDGGSLAQRLQAGPLAPRPAARLVADLAAGVQAAHGLGIIHRDLKPANVLFDGAGAVKVADFGLAKRLDQGPGLTASGFLVGTPAYMAPEQAEGRADVGTAADVYALGAILYECLTGRPAVAADSALDALVQVRTGTPAAPRQLRPGVPRDLEVICLKCLEKAPGRRYPTAQALADDLAAFLADRPIAARPAGPLERAARWCRRHPAAAGLVTVATILVLVLAVGGPAVAWRERDLRAAEQQAKEGAIRERDRGDEVLAFVRGDLLDLASAEGRYEHGAVGLGKDATVRALLDRAAAKLPAARFSSPLVEAELRWTVGVAYRKLGEPALAVPHLERCVALRRAELGAADPATLDAQGSLAVAYHRAGRLAEALPLYEQGWAAARDRLGPDDATTLALLHNLAEGYRDAGRLAEALPRWEEVWQRRRTTLGADHPLTLRSLNNLAGGHQAAGRWPKAVALFEEALRGQLATLGTDHPDTQTTRHNLAAGYQHLARLAEAIALGETVLPWRRAHLGADHPETLATANNLALAYQATGHLDRAAPLLEAGWQALRGRLGADHLDTLTALNNVALAYQEAGQLDKALPLLEESWRRHRATAGADHPNALASLHNLGSAYLADGQPARAVPLLDEALRRRGASLGADHPDTLTSLNDLATAYRAAGQGPRALPLYEEALRRRQAALGAGHPDTLTTRNDLAVAYAYQGQWPQAITHLEAAWQGRKAGLGAAHPETLRTQANLGVAYRRTGRAAEAVPLLEGANRYRGHLAALRWVRGALIEAYLEAGHSTAATPLVREELADARATLPAGSLPLASALVQRGDQLLRLEAFAEAEAALRECLAIREKAQPAAWTTANARSVLGGALLGQQKYAEAEPLLVQGWEGLQAQEQAIPPGGGVYLGAALARLVQLYEATGKPEAAPYRRRLAGRLIAELHQDWAWPLLWGWPR